MINPKKKIATRFKREEEQGKSGGDQLDMPIASRRNVGSRVDVNKNKTRDITEIVTELTNKKKKWDMVMTQASHIQQELSVQRKKNASLTTLLESKEWEIAELKQTISIQEQEMDILNEKYNKEVKLSQRFQKRLNRMTKLNEKLEKQVSLMRDELRLSNETKEENERLLTNVRQTCKQLFNHQAPPDFVQTYSDLIADVKRTYETNCNSDVIQHCPAIEYINSIPERAVIRPFGEVATSGAGPPAKRRRFDNSTRVGVTQYSENTLRQLVMNLESRHSEYYQLWRNVLWALNKYGTEQGYDTLRIADSFSRRSSKYKNREDVAETFNRSDGTLSLPYLVEISKVYEEDLEALTEYLNTILPARLSPLAIKRVDIRDRKKFELTATKRNESHTLFIIPDLCVLTDENDSRICFLAETMKSKSSELASLCPDMEKGFVVNLNKKRFEFNARNHSSAVIKLYSPLQPADSFIILPSGKQDRKESHLTNVRKALRAAAIKLLTSRSGKKFGDEEDDSNIVIMPAVDPDSMRSDVELVEALFNADPNTMSRYCFTGKTIYHCNPETNLWYKLSEKAFNWHLRKNFKAALELSKVELRYIGKSNAMSQMRNVIMGEIENLQFANYLDSSLSLFVTNNKTVATSTIPPVIRNIEKADLAETTSGWSYDSELSAKYMNTVQSYFEKLIPIQNERDWFLSFLARMLSGHRTDEFFLVLMKKRDAKNGTSTLMSLLNTVFGNYYIANGKLVTVGSNRDNSQYGGGIYDLKGKRLLVTEPMQKTDELNGTFIKDITGKSNFQIQDKKKFGRTQFQFPVQAGLMMIFVEEDVPKFNKSDQDFVKRMVPCRMRSRFLNKDTIDGMNRIGEETTDTHIADESLKLQFPEWRSAVLDLLMKYYNESLPAVPDSMMDCKKLICKENFDYSDWLDTHICRVPCPDTFVTATKIMNIVNKKENYVNPREMQKLKSAMAMWAEKNGYFYKSRHVYMVKKGKRVEAKSVIMNASIYDINEE